jgi:hypothetical protein
MDIDKGAGKLFQCVNRTEDSVQINSVSPGSRDRSPDDELELVRAENSLSPEPRKDGMSRWYLKDRFELRFILAKTDLLTRHTPADKKRHRIDQQGLPCPCLSGQYGKPRVNVQTQLLNDGKIRNTQLSEHGCDEMR